jgi:hypothetical protein
MINEDVVRFLLVTSDSQLAHQLIHKLQEKFAKMEPTIEIFDQGRKALTEFLSAGAQVVIIDGRLAFDDLSELNSQIRRRDGGCFIIQLGDLAEGVLDVSERFNLPIIDWADFLSRVQAGLPDEIKIRFGCFERNSALFDKLVAYGARWQNGNTGALSNNEALVLIPKFFDKLEGDDSLENSAEAKSSKPSVIYRSANAQETKVAFIREFLASLFFVFIAIGFNWYYREETWNWFSLRSLTALIAIAAVLGFFISRAFDRFTFGRDIETNN